MVNDDEEGFNLPKAEEKILEFWKTNRIFEKSLVARKGPTSAKATASKEKTFVFYEGPPYANGRPGIHHVLARIYKDIILRYKTMRGYFVPRRAGWDTHGLPVEIAAEKALGLKSKKDIEKFGIKRFNEEAKKAVWLYKDEWEKMTERIGYWLDLKNAYATYEPEYIETIWWTLAQIWKRKLLYKGHKVVPWCTRCGTALSSHELAQGYREVEDNSVYLKFKLKPGQKIGDWFTADENVYVLSWTTTPWTLPGNVALAVGDDIEYVVLKRMLDKRIERWIIAKDVVTKPGNIFGSESDTRELFSGKELVGLAYEPLFEIPGLKTEKSYKIYSADFVNTEEGTGVVHAAVMYGEDDYQLGIKVGLPQHHTVDEEGKFTRGVPGGLVGLPVKDPKTEEKIFEYLKRRGTLFRLEKYTHEYPYCWRCETPVIYYARTSWFIAMSKLRGKLLTANKKINWIPEHIKDGRFGEWLREVKDWNLSRERYWGTPLPIWECKKCERQEVISSLDELSEKTAGSKNQYWVMRHGEGENNIFHLIVTGPGGFHLTPRGKKMVSARSGAFQKFLKEHNKKIDTIIASDLLRTKETANIDRGVLGAKELIFDERLREIQLGPALAGCHDSRYHEFYPTYESKLEKRPEKGESLRDLRRRMWEFIQGVEKKHHGKNILLVSHEYPIWMLMHAACGWSEKRAIAEKNKRGKDFIDVAEIEKLDLKAVPRDETGLVDLHRPFVDEIVLRCSKCGGAARRVKEVADVWYDSGAMPFAQVHFPFASRINADLDADKRGFISVDRRSNLRKSAAGLAYPADYIAEAMDQTRGWFYTLLAIATALDYGAPYKNVVSLGLINDKFGQKMSKSKGNVVDPWDIINKYGADAVRWYFYTAKPPGEPKNFDEQEVAKALRRMHMILWNSFMFYRTYADIRRSKRGSSQINIRVDQRNNQRTSAHPLDEWILARLNETTAIVTEELDAYHVREAALAIETIVDDLSRWYIRRSRRRFQPARRSLGTGGRPVDKKDFEAASATLGFVLLEITKLLAPFTPFFSELLYEQLRGATRINADENRESVHLSDWPVIKGWKLAAGSRKLLEAMAEVRRLASLGLAKRAEAGIKVRQPLAKLSVKRQALSIKASKELLGILADEVNVKEVVFDPKIKDEVELDTKITPELKEEGLVRELVRMIQGLRQEAGLHPKDRIVLMMELPEPLRGVVMRNELILRKEVGAVTVEYKMGKFVAETNAKIEEQNFWLAVRKK